jgi:hypothetical protein
MPFKCMSYVLSMVEVNDTISHGLLMAKQDGKGWCFSFPLTSQSCSHVALALPPQEVHMVR